MQPLISRSGGSGKPLAPQIGKAKPLARSRYGDRPLGSGFQARPLSVTTIDIVRAEERQNRIMGNLVVLSTVATMMMWALAAVFEAREWLLLLVVIAVGLVTILLALGRVVPGLVVIGYLCAIQPAIRSYVDGVPYLLLEYALPVWAGLIFWQLRGSIKPTIPLIFFSVYFVLEVAGLAGAIDSDFSRSVLISSLTLLLFVALAANVRLTSKETQSILLGFIVGALNITVPVARIYFTGQVIQWTSESNFDASGGMGPNQVSLLLSAAVFVCLLLGDRNRGLTRIVLFGIAAGESLLMILTFSRGGLYILVGVIVTYYVLARRPDLKSVGALLLLAGAAVLTFNFAIDATGGEALVRYTDLSSTHRLDLAQQGYDMFRDNWITGVGTGNYYSVVSSDEYFGRASGAHNELTRAAAEHGIFGALAWLGFAISALLRGWRGFNGERRALRASLLAFALISMLYNGLKLILQPFLVFVSMAAFTAEDEEEEALPEITPAMARQPLRGSALGRAGRAI